MAKKKRSAKIKKGKLRSKTILKSMQDSPFLLERRRRFKRKFKPDTYVTLRRLYKMKNKEAREKEFQHFLKDKMKIYNPKELYV